MTSQAWVYVVFVIAVLAAAYQTQAGWLFVMGGIASGVLIVATGLAAWNMRGVRAEVLAPLPIWQGDVVELGVNLRTAGTAHDLQLLMPLLNPIGCLFSYWRDSLIPAHWVWATAPLVGPVPTRLTLRWVANVRGEHPLPTIWLQSAWPLGLLAFTRPLALRHTYLVYPVGPHLAEVPWLTAALARAGQATRVSNGQGQLMRGVREYRSGDALRQIHWKTTARLGAPFVKETEREAGEALVLWLDLRASVHTPATLEHMVTVAAALVQHLTAAGRQVRFASQPEAEPDVTGRAGDPAFVWLALAQATASDHVDTGPKGSLALSPAALPGWTTWAAAFVQTPASRQLASDATAICPVGEDLAEGLASGRVAL